MAMNSKNWCDVHRINFSCERTCTDGPVACPECMKAALLQVITVIEEHFRELFQDLRNELTFIPHEQRKCICNEPENVGKDIHCPKHGDQHPSEVCPKCGTYYLGTCPQGEYCTSDACKYVA